jgi:hypothetical protein
MRIIYLIVLGLFFAPISIFSQKKSPIAHKAIEHMLEEKVRNLPIEALIDWQRTHPGQPIPPSAWVPTQTVKGRNADTPVSENPEAESEVHAAINPADSSNIIVSGIVQDASNPLASLDIPIRYTTNFGQTWQTSSVDFSPGPGGGFALVGGGGDPVIAFDKSGKAFVSWLVLVIDIFANPAVSLSLYSSESTNKGQTWNAPKLIDKGGISLETLLGSGTEPGDLVDKQWMDIDRTSGNAEGTVYVAYTRFEIVDSITATAQILLKKKAKNSNAYTAQGVQVHSNSYAVVQFSSIAVDQNGAVHVTFFGANTPNDGAMYHAISTNGGLSFSPETKVSDIFFPSVAGGTPTDTIPGISSDRLYPCPHMAVGKTPNTLYATWSSNGLTDNDLTPGYDVFFAKSTDNGQTWGTPQKLNAGTNDNIHQFYPAIYVNNNGTIFISHYDRSNAPNGSTETHYVMAYSKDEGASFEPAVNASSESSDFGEIGALNGGFGIGEYTQVVATNHFAIPVWADGRTNDGNIELYAAFIPITGGSNTYDWGTLTDAFSLAFQNPSKEEVVLQLTLKQNTPYSLRIFDAKGQEQAQFMEGTSMPTGTYTQRLRLPAGQYLVRVETMFGVSAKKLVVTGR